MKQVNLKRLLVVLGGLVILMGPVKSYAGGPGCDAGMACNTDSPPQAPPAPAAAAPEVVVNGNRTTTTTPLQDGSFWVVDIVIDPINTTTTTMNIKDGTQIMPPVVTVAPTVRGSTPNLQ